MTPREIVPWRRREIVYGANLEAELELVPEQHRDAVAELFPRMVEGQLIRWSKKGEPYLFDPTPRPASGMPASGMEAANYSNPAFGTNPAFDAWCRERASLIAKIKEQAVQQAYSEIAKLMLPDGLDLQQRAINEALAPDATDKDKDRGLREFQNVMNRLAGKARQVTEIEHSGGSSSHVRRMAERALARRQGQDPDADVVIDADS